ncbi:MAG: serine hydrolase domain-containing protein [Vicinamibacterales bacterium]
MTTWSGAVVGLLGLMASPLVLVTGPAPRDTEAARWQAPCSANARYSGPPQRAAPAAVWERDFARPVDGALPDRLVVALDRTLDGILARVPAASVAVAIPGQGVWSRTRGLARRDPPAPVVEGQRFQAASTTKTFTASVVLQLVQEGRLRLDETVDRWFPSVPNARVTTIDMLLRHQSGLVSFNALPSLGPQYRTAAEVIALAAEQPPQFCPGTAWAYTNTGYAMLGVIVERIEGAPLHEVFARRLVGPLGLVDTVLRRPGDGVAVVTGHASGRPVQVDDDYGTAWAAGGLATTAVDLVRFWHALLSGRVLPAPIVRAMFTAMSRMVPDGQMFYGRGVQLYDVPGGPGLMFGHSGGIAGFTSVTAYVAADDLYVAVLFNDKDVPAEAGLWALVRAVREYRASTGGLEPGIGRPELPMPPE